MQQLELVNILLKYGADKALRNKANKLPIELVQQDRDRVGYHPFDPSRFLNTAHFSSIFPLLSLAIKIDSHQLFIR